VSTFSPDFVFVLLWYFETFNLGRRLFFLTELIKSDHVNTDYTLNVKANSHFAVIFKWAQAQLQRGSGWGLQFYNVFARQLKEHNGCQQTFQTRNTFNLFKIAAKTTRLNTKYCTLSVISAICLTFCAFSKVLCLLQHVINCQFIIIIINFLKRSVLVVHVFSLLAWFICRFQLLQTDRLAGGFRCLWVLLGPSLHWKSQLRWRSLKLGRR